MDYAQKLVELEAERQAAIAVLTAIEERISKTHFLAAHSDKLKATKLKELETELA